MKGMNTMNEGYKVWGALESVLSNKGLGIHAKKCLYILRSTVIVPTTLGYEKCCEKESECSSNEIFESLVGFSQSKVFCGQEPPSGKSTTTECGFNYHLLA